MRKIAATCAVLFLAAGAWAAPSKQADANVLVIPRCAAAPTVDGKISPGEWDRAAAITGFQHIFGWMTERQPVAWVTYDDRKLYLAVRSVFPADSKLKRSARERDHKRLCADDAIELFVAPDFSRAADLDYHFLGNSLEVIQDFESRPSVGNQLLNWNGNWAYKCTSGPGWWDAELSIDLAELKLKPGADFGINVCRDYAEYVFTNWTTGGFRNYARARLAGDVPAVQMLSLGGILSGDAGMKLAVAAGTRAAAVEAVVEVRRQSDGALLKTVTHRLEAAAGRRTEVVVPVRWADPSRPVERRTANERDSTFSSWVQNDRKVVSFRVADAATGEVLMAHILPVKEGLSDYADASVQRAFEVFADSYPSYGVFRASVDAYDFDKKDRLAKISVFLRRRGGEEIAGCGVIDRFVLGYGESMIRHLPMEAGAWEAVFTALDKAGAVLARETIEFERKTFEWEGTRYGVSDEVIPPFTPLRVSGRSVFCWGREYVFSDAGLPEKVVTRDRQILVRPIALTGTAGDGRLAFAPVGRLQVVSAAPGVVRLRGYARSGDVRLESNVEIEYDGMMKFRLKLSPDREVVFKDVRLEIPLRNEHALLYHACGESIRLTNRAGYVPRGSGVVWRSREVPNAALRGTFIPYFWLGDYDRGFCWMADNDRGWIADDARDAVEFARVGAELTARVNFVSRERPVAEPREFVFALMAGPARPEYEGWRMDPLRSAWFSGVSTFQGYGVPPDMAKYLAWARSEKEKRGYWGVNTSPNDLWGVTPANLYYEAEWHPGVPTDKRNDYVMYNLNKLMDEGLIDGLYSDDVYPVADNDLVTGRGYVREDGTVQGGYSMFALRDFYRRAAVLFRSHKLTRRMMIHMTDSMVLPCYSFWDIKHDNEWRKVGPGGGDQIDGWDLGEICARTLSRQYGLAASWHTPSGWTTDPETGGDDHSCLLLLHDVLGRSDNMENRTLPAKRLFGFGEKDVDFLGYWVLQPDRDPAKKDVKVSAWVRRSKGTALVVVGNLSPSDWRGDLALPLGTMGLKGGLTACDGEETHARIPFSAKGTLSLAVGRHDYRLVLIGPAGAFPVDLPAPGAALERPAVPLPALCDEFTGKTLSPAWSLVASPVASGRIRTYRDRLMVFGSDYKKAAAERPLAEDNVTVRVRVERPSTAHTNWVGLALVWGEDAYVFAGPSMSSRDEKFVHAAAVGGKVRQSFGGPVSMANPREMDQMNWVRIDLSPEKIAFFGSRDGAAWVKDWEIPRPKELAGAPKTLRLGKSPMGDQHQATPGPTPVFFDNLLVGR